MNKKLKLILILKLKLKFNYNNLKNNQYLINKGYQMPPRKLKYTDPDSENDEEDDEDK